jgi:uncharacterized protein YkwD
VLGAVVLTAGLLGLPGCTSSLSPSPTTSTTAKPTSATPTGATPTGAKPTSANEPAEYAAQVVRRTNDVRAAERLPRLHGSACARDAAILRAAALAGKAGLTHAPLADVLATCVPSGTAAENLSRTAASPATVVGAWMRSPGHRSNLLDPDLTEIGVGCLPDGPRMLCSEVFLGP